MWHPSQVTGAPAAEPVTLAEAKAQCGIATSDTTRDTELALKISAARAYVERYCSVRLVTQTLVMACDGFADFARLPEAPIQSVTTVTYVDTAGADQTLPTGDYELRRDGLEPSIASAFGTQWPKVQEGSRISVTVTAGFGNAADVPPNIKLAVLMHVAAAANTSGRNTLVREEEVAGVGRFQYGGVIEVSGAIERSMEALLADYRRWPLT